MVRSSGGADVTVIDATNVADPGDGTPVVRMDNGEGADTLLDGFTITGGIGDHARFGALIGGGLFCDVGVSATISNCVFTGNAALIGGGAFLNEASPSFVDCVFLENENAYNGGGVYCYTSGRPSFTRCRFEANVAESGGGGVYLSGVLADFVSCAFIGNSTTEPTFSGGGMLVSGWSGEIRIDGCR